MGAQSPQDLSVHHNLILDLAIVTAVAAPMALLVRALGQPSILGYLLAGIVVGPYLPVPLFADPHRLEELAEVGVVLVMFSVGLEFRIRRFLDLLPTSGLTAAVQIGALMWAGTSLGTLFGWSTAASVTLGAALAISSTMVVSAVLRENPVDNDVRNHVFGVLIIQDLVAIVLMAVVTAIAAGQSLGADALLGLLTNLAVVVVGLLVAGMLVLPPLVRAALSMGRDTVVVLVGASAFGFATAAESLGFSPALGAFLSGIAIAESNRGHEVEHALEPLRDLFSALFFVSIGMSVDPRMTWTTLPLALGLAATVVGVQFVSVTVSSLLSGAALRRSVFAALSLGQIGELSFIIATIAIGGGVMPETALPALVTVATITTFTTPFLLRRAEAIVAAIDRGVPTAVHRGLVAYQAFLRRAGTRRDGPSIRGAATAVVLDWTALMLLVAVRQAVTERVTSEWSTGVDIAVVVVSAPFVVGLVRSGWRLVNVVRSRTSQAPAAVARAVAGLAMVASALAIGVPTLGILGPVFQHTLVEVTVGVSLLVIVVVALVRLGGLDGDRTSGVERLAERLAERAAAGNPEPTPGEGPLAGLDYRPLVVVASSPADGKTLAELELRVKTGATVVAAQRGERSTLLPDGDYRIEAGDILAVSGNPAALDRAAMMLGHESKGPAAAAPAV